METIDRGLLKFTRKAMYRYGAYTNEERALPDFRDGLKPVHRRVIWALKHLPKGAWLKTARVVGETLGKYHPHGDAPVNGAIDTLINASMPPFKGKGNWGTLLDGPAAMRYTNLRLNKYGETFINPDYLQVSKFIPNYENTTDEPVILPALLPNLLLNGTDGIGVGVISRIPPYTLESVLGLMVRILKKEKLEINDYAENLVFNFPWGGRPIKSKENRKAVRQFLKTGEGSIQFESVLKISDDQRKIIFDDFAPRLAVEKITDIKLKELNGVKSVINTTDKKSGDQWQIKLRKGLTTEGRTEVIKKIKRITSSQIDFKVNVTERSKDGFRTSVRLFSSNIPELMKLWLDWRVRLEVKCLDYKIQREETDIAKTKLLIHAIDNLDVVFKALKMKNVSREDRLKYLAKGLKIKYEQAQEIFALRVEQLSSLERSTLVNTLKEQIVTLGKLQGQRSKPSTKVRKDFERILSKMGEQGG